MDLPASARITQAMLDETLEQEPRDGKRDLEPFKTLAKSLGAPMTLVEASATRGQVEIHRDQADLWLCLSGEATIICDGAAPDAAVRVKDGIRYDAELRGSEIKDGVEYALQPGDWLFIPAGQPHQLVTEAPARFMVIKLRAAAPVPLERYVS